MSSSEVRTARVPTRGTRATTVADAPPGPAVLGRYRLQRRLGSGAFGTVWMARDERLERDVAVKILARERVVGGRFEREARVAARLAHPAIVTLYEAAVDDEGAYLVSELVLGSTLDALLAEGRLSDRDIAAIGVALCDALAHAHAQGVVHRDVKPSNVLVPEAPSSSAEVAKLTDFGVARVIGGDTLTMTGDVIGTLAYMAPEQADGLEAGDAADLYSLALVIYEALSGVNPVAVAASRGGASARRLGMHLPPLRRQRRDLPRDLGQAIDQALRPHPRERGTLTELRAALLYAVGVVGDEPGVVAGPWGTVGSSATVRFDDAWDGGSPAHPAHPADLADPAHRGHRATPDDGALGADGSGHRHRFTARAVGAATTAGAAAWLSATALHPAPVTPALAALLAAAATLVLPGLGWIALVGAAGVVAILHNEPGLALIILAAGGLPVPLLIRRPTAWPLPALAPALGLIGIAGAWPALAGRARTPWRRCVLGALGWVWLLLATPVAGRVLYLAHLNAAAGIPPHGVWAPSAGDTATMLSALAASGALAGAAVWALAALVAPWILAGRSRMLHVVLAGIWAAATAWGTQAVLTALAPPGGQSAPMPTASALVLGAVGGAVLALAPSVTGHVREARDRRSGARTP